MMPYFSIVYMTRLQSDEENTQRHTILQVSRNLSYAFYWSPKDYEMSSLIELIKHMSVVFILMRDYYE
jgi:hypothetical protein